MRNSSPQELLDELHSMLEQIDSGSAAVDAVLETDSQLNAEDFAWSDFQNLIVRCVCSFFANVAAPRQVPVCEAWTLGQKALAPTYPEADAFLDFAADTDHFKGSIVASLIEGLLAEYQQKQTHAAISGWLSSLSWDQKIAVARFLKREYLASSELPAALLPDFQLALQLEEIVLMIVNTDFFHLSHKPSWEGAKTVVSTPSEFLAIFRDR